MDLFEIIYKNIVCKNLRGNIMQTCHKLKFTVVILKKTNAQLFSTGKAMIVNVHSRSNCNPNAAALILDSWRRKKSKVQVLHIQLSAKFAPTIKMSYGKIKYCRICGKDKTQSYNYDGDDINSTTFLEITLFICFILSGPSFPPQNDSSNQCQLMQKYLPCGYKFSKWHPKQQLPCYITPHPPFQRSGNLLAAGQAGKLEADNTLCHFRMSQAPESQLIIQLCNTY